MMPAMLDLQHEDVRKEIQRLARLKTNTEAVGERTQQYWDQLERDMYFRGQQGRTTIGNVNGRLGYQDFNLSNADRWLDAEEPPPPDYQYNLFRRSIRQWTALFGIREPNTRIDPINPRDPVQMTRARLCNRVSKSLDVVLEPTALQAKLAFLLGKSGAVFAYTRWVSSVTDYGTRDVPVYSEETLELAPPMWSCPSCGATGFTEQLLEGGFCPSCGAGVPGESFDEGLSVGVLAQTGYRQIRNGSLVSTLHTLSSVTIPSGFFRIHDLPWIGKLEEKDIGAVAQAYGLPMSELRPASLGELNDPNGPMMRSKLASYDGSWYSAAQGDKVTEGLYWFQPACYPVIKNEQIRSIVEQQAPNGVKLTVVGQRPVGIDAENLTEVWSTCTPEECETMTPGPYLEDAISMTDVMTDVMEIIIESAAHSIPMTVYDPDFIDEDDLRAHGRMHSSFVRSKQRGMDMNRATGRIYPSEFRPEMMRLAESVFSKNDEMLGLLPILWGSVQGAETAFETDSARNQALAMLAIPWLQMRILHENIRRQALMQVAKHSDGTVHLPLYKHPSGNAVEIATIAELEDIAQGGWVVSSDEQMPQSPSQIRQGISNMMERFKDSPLLEELGFYHPSNLPLVSSYLGIPGMRSPKLEAVEAVQSILQKLLAEQPIQSGMDGGMSSSMQLDVALYDPELVVAILKPWLISQEGRSEEENNPPGWVNVRLFAEEAELYLQQQQQQAMLQEQQQQMGGDQQGAVPPPQMQQLPA